ncbi:hypothetical protein ACRALDRAFT_1092915 [Sodiomyces alcalophilus JCM 7366]|uniref:uncharacterized protein n=1 Tax=Sodiomyces alcalophilus JCM 7366 TaxID=591952 RepID=UPI0039B48D1B
MVSDDQMGIAFGSRPMGYIGRMDSTPKTAGARDEIQYMVSFGEISGEAPVQVRTVAHTATGCYGGMEALVKTRLGNLRLLQKRTTGANVVWARRQVKPCDGKTQADMRADGSFEELSISGWRFLEWHRPSQKRDACITIGVVGEGILVNVVILDGHLSAGQRYEGSMHNDTGSDRKNEGWPLVVRYELEMRQKRARCTEQPSGKALTDKSGALSDHTTPVTQLPGQEHDTLAFVVRERTNKTSHKAPSAWRHGSLVSSVCLSSLCARLLSPWESVLFPPSFRVLALPPPRFKRPSFQSCPYPGSTLVPGTTPEITLPFPLPLDHPLSFAQPQLWVRNRRENSKLVAARSSPSAHAPPQRFPPSLTTYIVHHSLQRTHTTKRPT